MKNYINYITENSDDLIISDINTLDIQELSYFDIINLCELKDLKIDKSYKDSNNWRYCDYIKSFKDNPHHFNHNDFHFLIGIKNKQLVSLFYKKLNASKNIYGDGYIISTEKGSANKMFEYMRKIGPFTTFSNLENIASIKAQLKIGAEILCLSDNAPDKDTETFKTTIDNSKILELMKNEKLYYNDTYTNEKFYFMNKKNEIDIRKLRNYLIENDDIKLVYPEKSLGYDEKNDKEYSGLKIYFYHGKN